MEPYLHQSMLLKKSLPTLVPRPMPKRDEAFLSPTLPLPILGGAVLLSRLIPEDFYWTYCC